MKILFVSLSNLEFNVRTPFEKPLGGTESAICYLSEALSARGHEVTIMANTEKMTLDGIKHVPVSDKPEDLNAINPDYVVVASAPQAFPALTKLMPNAKCIMWNHVRPDQPVMQHMFLQEIQDALPPQNIVYVSNMQRQHYSARCQDKASYLADPKHGNIISNAISPPFENLFSSANEIFQAKKCKGAYTSTPFRGLACLATLQELEIDVYSSMDVYQIKTPEYDKMYETLAKNDCLKLHGSISQKDLAEKLKPAAFFVYPSIFPECHSISILEAQAAGLKIITTSIATEPNPLMDILDYNSSSMEEFTQRVQQNVNLFRSNPEGFSVQMWAQVQLVNQEFTWTRRAKEWEDYLRSLT